MIKVQLSPPQEDKTGFTKQFVFVIILLLVASLTLNFLLIRDAARLDKELDSWKKSVAHTRASIEARLPHSPKKNSVMPLQSKDQAEQETPGQDSGGRGRGPQ